MKNTACYRNAVKLGLCGTIGLIVITTLEMISPFPIAGEMLSSLLRIMTMIAWLGFPFLVSFLANGKNGGIKQAMLAGSIVTVLGMGTCIIIGVILDPFPLYILIFFLPLLALGTIVLGGLGTVAGLARSLISVRIGLCGALGLIIITLSQLFIARDQILNVFSFFPENNFQLVMLAAWPIIPFTMSFLLTRQTRDVRQATLGSSFAIVLATAVCIVTLFIASFLLFPGIKGIQGAVLILTSFVFLIPMGCIGFVAGLIGSFLGRIVWIR